MSLTPDEVRELAARSEGTFLDFKVADYNWSGSGRSANAELAKDLMAMANALGPGAAPAHILIGVEDDGTIVGIPASSHLDDASLHQKVRDFFVRPPVFEYTSVDVDGCSIGVYTIQPGGRPHFPLRESSPSLRKHVAMYRDGTATEVASPHMILDWDREDDPIRHEQRILELRRLEFEIKKQEAQARVQVRFSRSGFNHDADRTLISLILHNDGQCGIFIDSLQWSIAWSPDFLSAIERANFVFPEHYSPPHGEVSFDDQFVRSQGRWDYNHIWSRSDRIKHFDQYGMQGIVGVVGYRVEWEQVRFEVICRSELGGHATLSCST